MHVSYTNTCTACTVYTREWAWDEAHILSWWINKKAMPCVSGRESQSAGSLLQVNSPENLRTIYTDYTVYLHVLIKRLFLPDLVLSGSGWRCSSLETSATFCNSTSRLLYGVPAIPSPLPSTWRDPIQSNRISVFILGWDATLNSISDLAEKRCYGVDLIISF